MFFEITSIVTKVEAVMLQKSDELSLEEARYAVSDAAALLVPLADLSTREGPWPIEVMAWLIMVRDSFSERDPSSLC